MKKKIILSTAALMFTFAFISCKKDKGPETNNPTMIAGKYKLTSAEEKHGNDVIDLYIDLDDCIKDNILELKTNYTFKWDDIGQVCVPIETVEGEWKFKGRDSLTVDGATAHFKLVDKKLILTEDASFPGDPATLTMVYTRQ